MKFKATLKSSNALIDMTPLVDVIFLMLIFFIITSDILPLKSLNISNPKLHLDSTPLTTQVLVVMDAQNVIYAGSKKAIVDLTSLKEYLQHEISTIKKTHAKADPSIVLNIDSRVDYGSFLRVFAIVQETGQRIRLVYEPTTSE